MLRRTSTDAEAALWLQLRGKRLADFKFRRQHPIGPFILDFYCPAKQLAVELDGGQHYQPSAQVYDEERTQYLRRRGVSVLRFPNDLVLKEISAVIETIALALGVGVGGPSP